MWRPSGLRLSKCRRTWTAAEARAGAAATAGAAILPPPRLRRPCRGRATAVPPGIRRRCCWRSTSVWPFEERLRFWRNARRPCTRTDCRTRTPCRRRGANRRTTNRRWNGPPRPSIVAVAGKRSPPPPRRVYGRPSPSGPLVSGRSVRARLVRRRRRRHWPAETPPGTRGATFPLPCRTRRRRCNRNRPICRRRSFRRKPSSSPPPQPPQPPVPLRKRPTKIPHVSRVTRR